MRMVFVCEAGCALEAVDTLLEEKDGILKERGKSIHTSNWLQVLLGFVCEDVIVITCDYGWTGEIGRE